MINEKLQQLKGFAQQAFEKTGEWTGWSNVPFGVRIDKIMGQRGEHYDYINYESARHILEFQPKDALALLELIETQHKLISESMDWYGSEDPEMDAKLARHPVRTKLQQALNAMENFKCGSNK